MNVTYKDVVKLYDFKVKPSSHTLALNSIINFIVDNDIHINNDKDTACKIIDEYLRGPRTLEDFIFMLQII